MKIGERVSGPLQRVLQPRHSHLPVQQDWASSRRIIRAATHGHVAGVVVMVDVQKKPGKKIWRIKKGAQIPVELKLVKDRRPGHDGHYMIAASYNMPLKKYLGALEELGLDRSRVQLLVSGGIANVG